MTRAPGIEPIATYNLKIDAGQVWVTGRRETARPKVARKPPGSVTIVGGGGAGWAAVRRLRQLGFRNPIHVFSAEGQAPYDRTKLSKAYLAQKTGRHTLPLGDKDAPLDKDTFLHLSEQVMRVDVQTRELTLGDGRTHAFEALLLATGATPKTISSSSETTVPVHVLRSLDDADALVALAAPKARVVVIGAGFIGLEAAGSLCQQGLSVDVISPDEKPLDRLVGPTLGSAIRLAHEQAGVSLRLGETFVKADATGVTLGSGEHIACDFVLLGIGVTPNDSLAREAGLAVDDGILVDAHLETSHPGIYAAGDVARLRAEPSERGTRIEHWAVALGQAQIAAENMLGAQVAYGAPAFFWTEHFGLKLRYVGHAEHWEEATDFGALSAGKLAVKLGCRGKTQAVVTVGCDEISLAAEACLEAGDEAGLERVLQSL